MTKKQNGITLVALIITIIILLILAGITISTLTNTGLFKKAQQAKTITQMKSAKEEIEFAIMEETIKAEIGENLGNKFIFEHVWEQLRKEDLKLEVIDFTEGNIYKVKYKNFWFKVDKNNKTVEYIEDGKKENDEISNNTTENGNTGGNNSEVEEIYTITYNKNDGSGEVLKQEVKKGNQTTLSLQIFTRGGYKIEGWYTNKETTGNKIQNVTGDIEVFAKWVVNTEVEDQGSTTIDGVRYERAYEIWNKEQLTNFKTLVNGGDSFENCIIKQKADINLNNATWEPIGSESKAFAGVYDGENHAIEGLYANQPSKYDVGLFGYALGSSTRYSEIRNLSVSGTVIGKYNVGGILGRGNYVKINNCQNHVSVTSNSYAPDVEISGTGGIIGRLGTYGGSITNCKNYGTIKGSYNGIGGCAGFARNGEINTCENYTIITNNVSTVGGIVGQGVTNIESDKNSRLRILNCTNNESIQGKSIVGGIIGWTQFVQIEKCYNKGTITATTYITQYGLNSSNSGGIAGGIGYYIDGSYIKNSYNYANITGTNCRVGGITGSMFRGTIENCINSGNVSSGGQFIGGITGETGINYDGTQFSITISKSKNTGIVTGNNNVGGITGQLRLQGKITLCANRGNIIATGKDGDNNSNTGGISGGSGTGSEISYSYNTGNVKSIIRVIGGICGNSYGTVKYCYNTGDITNTNTEYYGRTGGIVGYRISGTITSCWQLQNCVKQGTTASNGGITIIEKTESEMKNLNFTNFVKGTSENNGYPILSWEADM